MRCPFNLLLCAGLAMAMVGPLCAQDEGPDVLYQQGLQRFLAGDYAGAVAKFQPIVDTFANEPELKAAMEQVFYALGSAQYNQQHHEEAIKAFEEYARRFPQGKFRDEVLFRIAASLQAGEQYREAAAAYRRVAEEMPRSDFVEDALFQAGLCLLQESDPAEGVAALEEFAQRFPRSAYAAQALLYVARARFEAGETAKALDTLMKTDGEVRRLDHVAFANFLAIEIGDRAFDETDYEMALKAYRHTRTRASLIRLQRRHVEQLEAAQTEMQRRLRGATSIVSAFREERRLNAALAQARELLTKIEGLPQYDAGLFHRIGSCFMSTDRFWEARVAFARVVAEAEDKTVREAAHFDLVLCLARLRRFGEIPAEADRYLKAYGKDEKLLKNGRVASIAFIRAESFINLEEFEKAEPELAALKRQFPQHAQLARIDFYLALAQLMQEKFDEGVQGLQGWKRDYPNHLLQAEVAYWLPVGLFYGGRYAEALPLFAAYAAQYPEAVYAPEASYRAALCKYSTEDFEGAAKDLGDWLPRNPGHTFAREARVTRGDALAAASRFEEAKTAYRAVTVADGPFYFMALNQAAKVWKALGTPEDFREMAQRYAEYIRDEPKSANVVDAAYQAGWAFRQLGREDQARSLYWNVLRQYGHLRAWEGFSPLLEDLQEMYRADEQEVLERAFASELAAAKTEGKPALAARLRLARVPKEPGRLRTLAHLAIAAEIGMDELGPDALAALAVWFWQEGERSRSQPYLERLLADFPASRYAPMARMRRAEQLLGAGQAEAALKEADLAVGSASDPAVFVESLFVRAECRRALEQWEGAIEDYQTVLAARGSDRTLKPRALLGLASCHDGRGQYAKAIPFYQRIYVLYRAYTGETAQAYLKSGQAFESLKDWQAAGNTYRELLADEKLAKTPEADEARKRLARIGS